MNLRIPFTCFSVAATLAMTSCTHAPTPTPGNNMDPADTTTTVADPAHPKFKTDILPIFTANCSGCHNNRTASDGYDFTSYAAITARKFVAGNLDKTKLYDAITDDDDDDRMPQAPAPRLSPEKILLIKNWILNGAPNN